MLKKLIIAGSVLLLLVICLLAFLLLGTFDSETLGNLAMAEMSKASGLEINAKSFSLNLLKGLTLEGVTASGTSPEGELNFTLEKLVFEHRLAPSSKEG
jgi:hypothetical protein